MTENEKRKVYVSFIKVPSRPIGEEGRGEIEGRMGRMREEGEKE